MNISAIGQPDGSDRIGQIRQTPVERPQAEEGRPTGARQDSVQVRDLVDEIKNLPETRPERIAQVRRRMASGFYDQAGVAADAAAKILESGALGDLNWG